MVFDQGTSAIGEPAEVTLEVSIALALRNLFNLLGVCTPDDLCFEVRNLQHRQQFLLALAFNGIHAPVHAFLSNPSKSESSGMDPNRSFSTAQRTESVLRFR